MSGGTIRDWVGGWLDVLVGAVTFGLQWLAVTARLMPHVVWIRANAAVARLLRGVRPVSRVGDSGGLRRKVLVVGDGNVEGVGDWVIMGQVGGLERRLEAAIAQCERMRAPWVVESFGNWGATSQEWAPAHKSSPRYSKWGVKGSLWSDLQQSGHTDADAVVVMVGSTDAARHSTVRNSDETAENISRLVAGLRTWPNVKLICVVGLGPAVPDYKARNLAILKFSAEEAERAEAAAPVTGAAGAAEAKGSAEGDGGGVARQRKRITVDAGEVARLTTVPAVGSRAFESPDLFCFDGVHFSSKGYGRVAAAVFKEIEDHLVQIDFAYVSAAMRSKFD